MEKSTRIASIDIFRGLTMILMIWVNDFWTLQDIPKWLKHASAGEDYLGFSDLIFPWFLFAVGMSIPFAIENRLRKDPSYFRLSLHIIVRTIALVVMGLFHVNMENYNYQEAIMAKPYYVIIVTAAFFLVWNIYPKGNRKREILYTGLKLLGIAIMILMIFLYSGKDYDGNLAGFRTYWWGILGLIGWVYFPAAFLYLIFRKSMWAHLVLFGLFLALNFISSSGISYNIFNWQSGDWFPGSGGLQALAFGGIITTLVMQRLKDHSGRLYIVLMAGGAVLLASGLLLRDQYMISKISGTPTWIMISLSTAIFFFLVIHWIADLNKRSDWTVLVKTAGAATLTCYLVPYFYYSLRTLSGIEFPEILTTGWIGLLKSMGYSVLIVAITWGLNRIGIKLKI